MSIWREVNNMDAAYEIYNSDNIPITLQEFYKLDPISKELCTIVKPDGTILSLNEDVFKSEGA